ncbi:MAG: glycoside hydrolase family 97 protein [Sedimentisphaerales bacterium]|nr:glycoside hydrolase family 97 protein [Sedimentisphaerales bacterium]
MLIKNETQPCLAYLGIVWLCMFLFMIPGSALAAEHRLSSPDGRIDIVVSDTGGLRYRVEIEDTVVLTDSVLGLEFRDGIKLGPSAIITKVQTSSHDGQWENPFGQRRIVPDNWRQLHLMLAEQGPSRWTFGLIVRAYNDGVAFRYDLPKESGIGDFVLTDELTEFRFAEDYRCWAGNESACAENQYPEKKLSAIRSGRAGRPFQSVLPLLVETPLAYIAVAESDLLDWAGMSLAGTGTSAVKTVLDRRSDGNGLVVSSTPRVSPWRVLVIGQKAKDLVDSDLIATLASPSCLKDTSWIKPGACAWDAWWTGTNPYDSNPGHKGVYARGSTPSHKEWIDLAAEMGWPYQLMDWFWYKGMTSFDKTLHSSPNPVQGDFRQPVPEVDVAELVRYAKSKNVRLLIWAHSLDIETFGVETALAYLAKQGFAGVKIDFFNSQSQETVQWCENALSIAAKHGLLVNFHGTYKPAGMARTYPNFITQEGVLGNEYNKLGGNQCTPLHTITLPFTRGLLGPMDFTPGGFINRAPGEFKLTSPSQVMGSRARQLAMTVVYFSPLQVLCDSPRNYRGQPGVGFLRNLPTVWDETVVLDGDVARSIIIARRSGDSWYLAAMNGDEAMQLQARLTFLDKGKWTLRSFADNTGSSDYQAVAQSAVAVDAKTIVPISMLPAGGFAGIITREK